MKYDNPTALQIGHEGVLSRRRYRVVGRVVLGMEYEGTVYHWNEYHLKDEGGRSATLVYEETEDGPVWRLFTIFEPAQPIGPKEARSVVVGQSVQLDGVALKVDLVDESRVYHIEGEAPEGVELGDVAGYFNASSSDRMVVVSWSGDEVEHFHGLDLSASLVAGAFNVPQLARSAGSSGGGNRLWTVLLVFGLFVVAGTIWFALKGESSSRAAATPAESKAIVRPVIHKIPVGALVRLGPKEYVVRGSAEIMTSQYKGNYTRFDHWLEPKDGGNPVRLFRGLGLSGQDCYLGELRPDVAMPSPQKAALLRVGSALSVGDEKLPVGFLFRSKIVQVEGLVEKGLVPGRIHYQLVAQNGAVVWILGWNEAGICAWRGTRISEAEVNKSLSSGSAAVR